MNLLPLVRKEARQVFPLFGILFLLEAGLAGLVENGEESGRWGAWHASSVVMGMNQLGAASVYLPPGTLWVFGSWSIAALLLGGFSFAHERDRGTLALLAALPVPRRWIWLSKLITGFFSLLLLVLLPLSVLDVPGRLIAVAAGPWGWSEPVEDPGRILGALAPAVFGFALLPYIAALLTSTLPVNTVNAVALGFVSCAFLQLVFAIAEERLGIPLDRHPSAVWAGLATVAILALLAVDRIVSRPAFR